jgi:hypothetical protein
MSFFVDAKAINASQIVIENKWDTIDMQPSPYITLKMDHPSTHRDTVIRACLGVRWRTAAYVGGRNVAFERVYAVPMRMKARPNGMVGRDRHQPPTMAALDVVRSSCHDAYGFPSSGRPVGPGIMTGK